MADILLITPPFTQLNTPYPATAYIKGFLNTIDISAYQMDLGIEVILKLFSRDSLKHVFHLARIKEGNPDANSMRIMALEQDYLNTIEEVIAFLQGKNPTIARQICSDNFLPKASRFQQVDSEDFGLDWAFGIMGMQDRAKHLATLYLEDLSDLIVQQLDPYFGFSRYAERLGRSANDFDELQEALDGELSYIDEHSCPK